MMIEIIISKLREINKSIDTDLTITGSPLFGAIRCNIDSAICALRLVEKLEALGVNSAPKWQSYQHRINNYESLKEENRVLKEKLETIRGAINDNPPI